MTVASRWLGSLLPALSLFVSIGPCVRVEAETPDAPPRFVLLADQPAVPASKVLLPSGCSLAVREDFRQRSHMWRDASLMFADYRDLYVLDGGASALRAVYHNPDNYQLSLRWGRSVSTDRSSVLAWFDPFHQLVRMDLRSGAVTRLTEMTAHVYSLEFRRHLDPEPVARDRGVVEDPANSRLLFVVQEESNDEVESWQQNVRRTGGHSIVAADPSTRLVTELSRPGALPGAARAWDVSLERGLAYVLVLQDGRSSIFIRKLDGELVREVTVPGLHSSSERIALSPDERTLLVELADHSWEPADTTERVGGFVLIDLDFLEITAGPSSGFLCTWSPDGRSIAYLDARELRLWDVGSGTSELLASRERNAPAACVAYSEAPSWSDEGHRLVVKWGGSEQHTSDWTTVAFDLEAREFLVMDGQATHAGYTWLPIPHPFPTLR